MTLPTAEQAPNREQLKTTISVTKCSSKITELRMYDTAISDPIHGQQWRKAIKEELQTSKITRHGGMINYL